MFMPCVHGRCDGQVQSAGSAAQEDGGGSKHQGRAAVELHVDAQRERSQHTGRRLRQVRGKTVPVSLRRWT